MNIIHVLAHYEHLLPSRRPGRPCITYMVRGRLIITVPLDPIGQIHTFKGMLAGINAFTQHLSITVIDQDIKDVVYDYAAEVRGIEEQFISYAQYNPSNGAFGQYKKRGGGGSASRGLRGVLQ